MELANKMKDLGYSTLKSIDKNSPIILTAAGCIGVFGTAYLAAKAAPKANYEIINKEKEKGENLTLVEKIKTGWKYYIPTIIAGGVTVASIVGSNRIATTRLESIVTAYDISEKARKIYQEKVVEEIGNKKAEKIESEVAQSSVKLNPPVKGKEGNILLIPNEKRSMEEIADAYELYYEPDVTGKYFVCDSVKLSTAVNEINAEINKKKNRGNYASLNQFFSKLKLPETRFGDMYGWNRENPCYISTYPEWLDPGNETRHVTVVNIKNLQPSCNLIQYCLDHVPDIEPGYNGFDMRGFDYDDYI